MHTSTWVLFTVHVTSFTCALTKLTLRTVAFVYAADGDDREDADELVDALQSASLTRRNHCLLRTVVLFDSVPSASTSSRV